MSRRGTVASAGQLPILPLHSLGWKGFQDLCATVLSEVLGQTFTIWSPSRDGGRDGAFYGTWRATQNETFAGTFVAQAKHTSAEGSAFTPSMIDDEFAKVAALVRDKSADVYVLLTNHSVSGETENMIRRALVARGVKHALIFGSHWISKQVYESSRLRALVPRVYGIGDLSEIIDERAYEQAAAVLATLEDEVRTFVPVDAFRRANRALHEHGFVCLIGEPGSGKSTIAAILTLLAADQWKLAPVRVHSPHDFGLHWNPQRPDQIFWADDAFGATQYDGTKSLAWRGLSREMRAAVKAGARFVLTTRDYIFRQAHADFRPGDLPVSDLQQVIIAVEDLSTDEKEEILYNHIKLGGQPKRFRGAIKEHLPIVAQRSHMLPEVAKRLANPFFTTSVEVSAVGLERFADDPAEYLVQVLRELGRAERATMVLLFSRGGTIASPFVPSTNDQTILEMAGATVAEVRDSLARLRDTLVRLVQTRSSAYWTYRHPTVHDAISTYVATDAELVGCYVRCAGIAQVLREVAFEGQDKPQGAHIVVARHLYGDLARRIAKLLVPMKPFTDEVKDLLSWRCDDEFLNVFIDAAPDVPAQLAASIRSNLSFNYERDILDRLALIGRLDPTVRERAQTSIRDLALELPDAAWIDSPIFTPAERDALLSEVRTMYVDDPTRMVNKWKWDCSSSEDPSDYFEPLRVGLKEYQEEFKRRDDTDAVDRLEQALDAIDSAIAELEWEYDRPPKRSSVPWQMPAQRKRADFRTVSRFDDLDD